MVKLSFNLPTRHRLHIRLVRRNRDVTPLLPDMGEIRRVRSGSKTSRFFRHIFEHKNIRRLLGTNLALLVIASSIIPADSSLAMNEGDGTLAEAPLVLTTQRKVSYPVEEVKISQGYTLFHRGIDFDGKTGDSVSPIMDGKVEAAGYSRAGYGNTVIVNHEGGVASLYAHLSKIEVSEGDEVTTFTKLGEMGKTGRANGDHLHLEVLKNGSQINPFTLLPR